MGLPRFHLAVCAAALLAIMACGCKTPAEPAAGAGSSLHERALRNFAAAHLVKPGEAAGASALLPPWILLEEPGASNRVPGALQDPALQKVDSALIMVYAQTGSILVRGTTYPQVTYLWITGPTPKWQGIRMTLNTSGRAVIWEVLRDSSGRQNIFVAESLEQAARQEIGAPLPGRRYSVEQSRQAAPKVEVVRVIEDGPVPMGPMVYQDGRLDVTTVICRCMPAQAVNLAGSSSYEVQAADGVLALWKQKNGRELWPQVPLENSLRLPRHF